jgi:NADPH-dependent 2,4-dienoyl-CoA reductase/sulfur reductase-like enzyme/nitrite reductase/ring-hydroxylating ferredoxin subunit
MSEALARIKEPDFSEGVAVESLKDGEMLKGHVRGTPALLVRRGGDLFAIASSCTHYGGPLGDGLLVNDTIRCPWHHACFGLRTGAVIRAPGLDPLQRWRVELRDGMITAAEELERVEPSALSKIDSLASVVIVGGGPAGYAAAATLRQEGYDGLITIFSADEFLPCDRPNLSKGYLAGAASDDSNLLKPADFYSDSRIVVRLNSPVARIDVADRQIELADGHRYAYDALLLATGASPVRLEIPGAHLAHVHYLRSLADSHALVEAAQSARKAVVIGASFIGLEVASSLRARRVEIDVVGPETVLMEKVLGPQVGRFLRRVHEDHGVSFHLGHTATAIDENGVSLDNGERIDADLVVVGIGVRPETSLADAAGLEVEGGVIVNQYLETSEPGIYAAGDIARWPDPLSGERIRVEHFVVAERQGQTAARNILGYRETFSAVPFFWTEQYDLGIAYVGHAVNWDEAIVDGDLEKRDCSITYRRNGEKLAVAVLHRDLAGLEAEVEFERRIAGGSVHQHDATRAREAEEVEP